MRDEGSGMSIWIAGVIGLALVASMVFAWGGGEFLKRVVILLVGSMAAAWLISRKRQGREKL